MNLQLRGLGMCNQPSASIAPFALVQTLILIVIKNFITVKNNFKSVPIYGDSYDKSLTFQFFIDFALTSKFKKMETSNALGIQKTINWSKESKNGFLVFKDLYTKSCFT